MKKVLLLIFLIFNLAQPAWAMDYTAPTVPDSGADLMPAQTETFSQGLSKVLGKAIGLISPSLAEAAGVCLSLVGIVMLHSVLQTMPTDVKKVISLVSSLAIAGILLSRTSSMLSLGVKTIRELSDYGKLLLPVLTAALAAQGGVTGATALYAGTAVFDTILGTAIAKLLIPMVYGYLILAIAGTATGSERLNKLRDLVKSFVSWCLKIIIYIFTGYITITGVISGSADATAIKVTKITMSGMIPVVGGILSDASEAVLVGAGVMKNAVGTYGLLAVLSVWIAPFLQIGAQYLLLKLTGALCATFGAKEPSQLIDQFSGAMGLLLGMTAAMCTLLLVSTVCFMRGVG
ncbi:MAG: stage III sporulation protein AE [Oscillospiraceae bacterium]|nr:stage III sporulation protein AE [Oscillospiraceae bacterium]